MDKQLPEKSEFCEFSATYNGGIRSDTNSGGSDRIWRVITCIVSPGQSLHMQKDSYVS